MPLAEWLLGLGVWCAVLALPAQAALLGHGGPVEGLAVSTDGTIAVTAGFDYSLIVWRLADESVQARLLGHDGPVNGVALAGDGRTAVSASEDGTVGVWDLPGGRLVRRLPAGASLAVVAVSPDGAQVAAGGLDAHVHRWRMADGTASPPLSNAGERVTALAYSADGSRIVAGGHAGSLQQWRSADGTPLLRVHAHDFALTGLATLPDGLVVSSSIDRSLRLLDPSTGDAQALLSGHEQPIIALAASADGRLLASAGQRASCWCGGWVPITPIAPLPAAERPSGPWRSRRMRPGCWRPAPMGRCGSGTSRPEPRWVAPSRNHRRRASGRGPALFASCAACHSLTTDGGNKAGPTLAGLFGRRAGRVAGYAYSPALRNSGIVWTEATVARLLDLGPDRLVPGSKMPLQRLPNPLTRPSYRLSTNTWMACPQRQQPRSRTDETVPVGGRGRRRHRGDRRLRRAHAQLELGFDLQLADGPALSRPSAMAHSGQRRDAQRLAWVDLVWVLQHRLVGLEDHHVLDRVAVCALAMADSVSPFLTV